MIPPARRIIAAALVAASTALAGCAHRATTSVSAGASSRSSAFLSPHPYLSPGRSVSPWGSSPSTRPSTGASRSSTSPTSAPRTSTSPTASTRLPARIVGPTPATASTPNAAALAGVKAIESSDTTVDADPRDTTQRASAWLTPRFAAQVKAFPPVAAPGATWNAWAAHRAYLTVVTSIGGDEHPSDTASTAYRQVIAVTHPIGRDGWKGPAVTTVVSVSLARVSHQWRLASSQSS